MNAMSAGFSKTGMVSMAAAAALLAGVISGMVIGARRHVDAQGDRNHAHRPASSGVAARSSSPNKGESNLDPTSAKDTSKPPPDPLKVAQELWDLVNPNSGARAAHPERQARIRELRPEMAEFFIGKFKELIHSTKSDRQCAMEMAIACGGPRAVDFVQELAETPAEGFLEYLFRTVAANCLSRGHLIRRPREFPVDEALLQQAHVLLNSSRGSDRRLAVVILGHSDVHRALPVVTDRLQADSDPVVREEAIRQLGRIGNQASLALLRAQGTQMADQIFASYVPPQPLQGCPVQGTDKRYFLSALNDAIEELEERLQKK
jgi:hypothetical protein